MSGFGEGLYGSYSFELKFVVKTRRALDSGTCTPMDLCCSGQSGSGVPEPLRILGNILNGEMRQARRVQCQRRVA